MRFIPAAPTPLAWVATCVLVGCESYSGPEPRKVEGAAIALSTYFPPSESNGGWRKTTDPARVRDLGLDAGKLNQLGQYLVSLPYENYSTGVSGYHASNKAVVVVKGGWIAGEYYNQASARTGLYYLASNGKTFAMLLAGHMGQTYPGLGFGLRSKLYDQRWLPEGFPLSDSRKAGITIDQVFRHTSGIIPQVQHQIASGAVQTESSWNFAPFTLGKDAQWPQSAKLYYTTGQPSSYGGDTYSSVAFNHLSLVFRNVSGREASNYFQDAILGPIGVGRSAYKLTAGMGDTKFATAGNALLAARDFVRVGYLMMHEGNWNGRRIFPTAWIRQFTGSSAYRNLRSNRDCSWGAKYPADLYRTTGSGLNWILVAPSLDLVVTFSGRTPESRRAEVDRESLQRLFAAVTTRYVACDGTVMNGGGG
ncbi:MAG TPA: serine hydrolase [Gemmatimonadales bacterium]|nr:serine hydrolase [Gemmatimonadales bacterium]